MKILKSLAIALLLVGLLRFLSFYSYPVEERDHYQAFRQDYGIYSLALPKQLHFSNEPLPMQDPQVREAFDRELLVNTYWQSQSVLFIKRAHRYFPIIEPILEAHGIPSDFKYLPLIESGFMNVVSPAGAVGFWQIMEATGKQYGLEINAAVDQRYHLEKSTVVACQYLSKAYRELGSWTLAAAAYNMGLGGVKKQLARQGGRSYYDLTLNSETARYVYRLVAVKELLSQPQEYGFHVPESDRYAPIPTRSLLVDTAISDLGAFSAQEGINYRILKYHNPWLRLEYLPAQAGKSYEIRIPKEGHFALEAETSPAQPAATPTLNPPPSPAE